MRTIYVYGSYAATWSCSYILRTDQEHTPLQAEKSLHQVGKCWYMFGSNSARNTRKKKTFFFYHQYWNYTWYWMTVYCSIVDAARDLPHTKNKNEPTKNKIIISPGVASQVLRQLYCINNTQDKVTHHTPHGAISKPIFIVWWGRKQTPSNASMERYYSTRSFQRHYFGDLSNGTILEIFPTALFWRSVDSVRPSKVDFGENRLRSSLQGVCYVQCCTVLRVKR